MLEKTIEDVFPNTKFDVIICLNILSYFEDHDIKNVLYQFENVMADDAVIYVNMYSTNLEWPIKKQDNGLWLAEDNGSVDKATWLNLAESKEAVYDKCCIEGLDVICVRKTMMECARGEHEVYHCFLERSNQKSKMDGQK